jgi:glycosyltransferase involved in cell wall biosynthesis
VDAEQLRRDVADLARGCEATICTTDELAEDLRAMGADPLVVPHGVDAERFAVESPPPDDLAELERPLIGYTGLVDDYLSFESLRAVADRLERGTVVLVGRVNTDTTALRHPRIVLLGPRPYDAVPSYVHAFACCLLPFAITRLTIAANPIKLREYLAAGRPVVSTALPAVLPFADVVELANEPHAFADAVIATLRPGYDSEPARNQRRSRAAAESWDRIADIIGQVLRKLLESPGV